MLFITSALLAFTAFKVTAYPRHEPGGIHHVESTDKIALTRRSWTHHVELSNPKRGVTHHVAALSNTTLIPRAEKGICATLELPTEASYKIGYEAFCTKYVPYEVYLTMGTTSSDLVATYMLKTHLGTEIPWIFKIRTEAWGGSKPYLLKRDKCMAGFRNMLEGERAKVGTNYCVVDRSGGNGESKKLSGQGFVLVTGGAITWAKGDVNDGSRYEARRRKGDFDPNNPTKV
ncbi:hypothetical protein BU25DRAFT_461079 [Macroventuria anomochaeta]|uniref:Uncharacterized protein n=1 Tax=Macroventuria anomochaeta TaxID=301207 RepID=A0ACB6RTE1_9PLEO|nr:uncharacterized protein BU25DRAFT_461079 [Macroventuria anomochaeta]KAF2624552.1 hypothetical protein BU25DRAFT_461079 [Macroventuria anomochaeta]